jgi:hypothetical protein
MKRCPNCQKEFPDSMRFCQTDGTPLVDPVDTAPPEDPFKTVVGQPIADDPYKTVVGGEQAKEEDLLQLPEEPLDPMKTMVVSPEDWKKEESSAPLPSSEPSMPEPPKFNEPDLNPPVFGDLSPQPSSSIGDILGSSSSSSSSGSTPFETPGEPKISDSPFGQPPSGSPFQTPFEQQKSSFEPPSPFDAPAPSPPPFDAPKPPPYKEPESPFGSQQSPYDQSPFSQPQSPLGQPVNDPFGSPSAQADWNPPPAPVQNWQDQNLGANTPFQPPVAGGAQGQNKTLAIVSLVCGILGFCCGILGIVGVVTGFMAKNNVDANPAEYGGRGMAIAGIILGAIGFLLNFLAGILSVMIR